jgi:hypothetical protein
MLPRLPRRGRSCMWLPFLIFSIMEPHIKKIDLSQKQFLEDLVLYI